MNQFLQKYKLKLILLFVIYIISFFIINYQNQIFLYFFHEKIWVHRVNSVEKLKEVTPKFSGVELDVVFNRSKNSFDVNHPPAQSINLSLIEYLSSIKLTLKNRFWIDFKNLSEDNMESSCFRLDYICSKLNLDREQFIIESINPKYLKLFNAKGFNTSYYLPVDLARLSSSNLKEKIKEIKDICSSNKTHYISTDKRDLKILKENFPDKKILTWSFNYSNNKTINPYSLILSLKSMYYKYKILSNKNVVTVLYRFDAQKGNR